MAGRPPQGRGSGGRVTPSAKRPVSARPATKPPAKGGAKPSSAGGSKARAKAGEAGTSAGGADAEAARSATATVADPAPAGFAGRMKQLLVPPSGAPVERERPWWGSGDVVIWFLVYQVALAVGFAVAIAQSGVDPYWPTGDGAVLGEIAGRTGAGLPPTVTETPADLPLWLSQGLALLPAWLVMIGGPAYVAWRKGFGIVRDFKLAIKPLDVPLGLVLGVVAQLVWVPASVWVVYRFTGDQDVSATARAITDKVSTPLDLMLLFVTVALIAPIAEEVFFRGLTFQAFARRLGVIGGILTSSVFFAVIHSIPAAIPAYIGFAALLAYLVHRYDRLGPAIAAHVGFNAVTAAMLVLGS